MNDKFDCPLCQSVHGSLLMASPAGNIWRCKECGLALRWPHKDADEMAAIRREKYGRKRGPAAVAKWKLKNQAVYRKMANQITSMYRGCNPDSKTIRILDVGSGCGELLEELAGFRGVNLFAVEPDEWGREWISKIGNVSLLGGGLDDVSTDEQFDIIVLAQVLEHCMDPLREISRAHNLMADNGMLYVTVPNINSCSVFLNKGRERNNTAIVDHLYFFSFPVLKRALIKGGFRDVLRVIHWTRQINIVRALLQYILRFVGVSREIRVTAFK